MSLDDLKTEFLAWHHPMQQEASHVAHLLSDSLPQDPTELIQVLSELESYNGRIGTFLVEAENFLKKFRLFYLTEKGDRSETERKVQLEADVADYELVKDKIEVLADCIKQRLIWGESRLAWERQFNIKPIEARPF